ncbi:MAG: hypothetical protein LBH44_08120 [Treponema sp.]|jgi:hypothetical protein|nr:hypothetical protein [Treponema sp.]
MNFPFEGIVRRKNAREAADSGLLIWRENFIFFLPFFAVPLWICAFSLRLLPGKTQYLSWLIIWFLKPLFDRIILHIISIRFFENGASMKRLCMGLGKTIVRGLAGDLLWRRFSPMRAAMIPVRVLEYDSMSGKKNHMIRDRRKLLEKGGIGYCSLLSLWGIFLEIVLLIGELLFFTMMAELIRKGFVTSFIDLLRDAEIYIFALWCFNYMLVETIYVCMGFGLYINSRIEVEGWDIEIMFRNFAKKLKAKNMNSLLIVFCAICLFLPVKTFADDWKPVSETAHFEKLQNILDSPDFGGEKDSWGIRLKKPLKQRDFPEMNMNPMLEKLRRILAFALRFVLVALIAAFLILILLYLRKYKWEKKGKTAAPIINAVHKKNAGSPELFLKKALDCFEHGNFRFAWGYCTAAAIMSFQLYRGIIFPPNATESDCANIVSSITANDEADEFCNVIKYWVNLAYAGRLPPEGSFEKAVTLCNSLRAANG